MKESVCLMELSWDEIKDRVKAVNEGLYQIIESIKPKYRHNFVFARYSFGDKIIQNGNLKLPNLIDDKNFSKNLNVTKIMENLGYADIPLSLVLEKSNEVYVEIDERITPLNYFTPGDFFGIFEVLAPNHAKAYKPRWEVVAGTRTSFMLPKITDKSGHYQLRKKYGFKSEPPKKLLEHFEIFKAITNIEAKNSWYNEILFFTKDWFQEDRNKALTDFKLYLLEINNMQMQLLRDAIEINMLWATFASTLSKRSFKPRLYLIDTMKLLISIARGSAFAFKPATTDLAIPLNTIQKAYINIYNLKNYCPTIMEPTKLDLNTSPVYYSLYLPTVLDNTPEMNYAPSIIEDLRNLKTLIEILIDLIGSHKNILYNPIEKINFNFYHPDKDDLNEVEDSRAIIEHDKRFILFDNNKLFCGNSPFFRGCIRLIHK